MKRCPKCGRNYNDDSMSFCLDDGAELLFGPASASAPPASPVGRFDGEPATAILHSTAAPGEAPTRAQIIATIGTAILPDVSYSTPTQTASRKSSLIAGIIGILLVTALGVSSYLYYGRGPSKQIESIAVMPFVNESENADVEYLSDGMTETLIRSLSQLANLQVKPRSSVFRYKGKETDAKTIGKELNVQAILNGRVVQRGDQLTLNLELIEVQKDVVLWSEQYIRKQADLVSLQSEIAKEQ